MSKTYQRVAGVIVLIGGIFLRIYHLFKIDIFSEPFRLGGLFVAFAEQIIQSGFHLPKTIPYYSQGGIPFAYPPLGFYVEAGLLSLSPTHQILIANLLPPTVAVFNLIAAFFFLRWYYKDQEAYILAGTFAYAFLPSAFTNQIEAAGVAESFGSLAVIFFFYCGIRFRLNPNWLNAVLTGLALGLSILSSPGSAFGIAVLCLVFGLEILIKDKFRMPSVSQIFLVAVTGMLISAPYWVTVITYHGGGIFFYPVLAQYNPDEKLGFAQLLFENLMNFSAVRTANAFLWNLIIFLGVLRLGSQGKWALPLAFLVLFTIPREGEWLIALPAALLFAHGFVDVLLTLIYSTSNNWWRQLGTLSFIGLMGYWMISQSFAVIDVALTAEQTIITGEQIKALQAARSLIPPDAKVLIIGNDAFLEWAPYELQREVINERFGLEWKPDSLPAVMRMNKQISLAQSWDEVLQILTRYKRTQMVYVVSSDKKTFVGLSHNSSVSIQTKLETTVLQVGVLNSQ